MATQDREVEAVGDVEVEGHGFGQAPVELLGAPGPARPRAKREPEPVPHDAEMARELSFDPEDVRTAVGASSVQVEGRRRDGPVPDHRGAEVFLLHALVIARVGDVPDLARETLPFDDRLDFVADDLDGCGFGGRVERGQDETRKDADGSHAVCSMNLTW